MDKVIPINQLSEKGKLRLEVLAEAAEGGPGESLPCYNFQNGEFDQTGYSTASWMIRQMGVGGNLPELAHGLVGIHREFGGRYLAISAELPQLRAEGESNG